jgi:hypothetical protein
VSQHQLTRTLGSAAPRLNASISRL